MKKDKLRLNLYHDWHGATQNQWENCPDCGSPCTREVITMVVDEIWRRLPWYKKL